MSDFNEDIKPKKSMYELSIDALRIIDNIELNDGEVTPEMEVALQEILSGGEDKIRSVFHVIKKFRADADYLNALASVVEKEVDRLKKDAKTNVNKAERLSKSIEAWMKITNTEKIKFGEVDMILRKSSEPVPPSDPVLLAKLPAECWTVPAAPAIAKSNFKAWVKANPADAELFGVTIVENKSILIR